MNVQPSNAQPNDPGYAGIAQNDGPGAQSPVSPEKFDTSRAGDTPSNRGSADVISVPDSALTPPAPGAPGTWAEQKSPNMVTHWQRNDAGQPVLKEVDPARNADGSTTNVATEFKLDSNGQPVLVGAHALPRPSHDPSQDRTAGDVFWSGVKDGATHPGQFFGALADKATGDKSGTNEGRGKEADSILAKLPVVGTALTITGGIAGQPNPDGSPQLPTPDVQPDVPGSTFGRRPAGGLSGGERNVPAMKAHHETVDAKPAMREGASGASNEVQMGKPSVGGSATNTLATTTEQFGVPVQYARTPGGDLHTDPGAQGVLRDDKGQAYIDVSGKTYPVRYDKDNGTWRVNNPDDPAKFQYPVRQDEQGNWQVHDDVGLKGGGNPGRVSQALLTRRTQLETQRQQLQHDQHQLQEQLRQFPGPQNAGRSGMELAYLHNALQGRLADVSNRLQNVNQGLQQVEQEIQQYQQQ